MGCAGSLCDAGTQSASKQRCRQRPRSTGQSLVPRSLKKKPPDSVNHDGDLKVMEYVGQHRTRDFATMRVWTVAPPREWKQLVGALAPAGLGPCGPRVRSTQPGAHLLTPSWRKWPPPAASARLPLQVTYYTRGYGYAWRPHPTAYPTTSGRFCQRLGQGSRASGLGFVLPAPSFASLRRVGAYAAHDTPSHTGASRRGRARAGRPPGSARGTTGLPRPAGS